MKNERKVNVNFVETKKPIDLSSVAEAIANLIKKEGIDNERRKEIS